MQSAVVAFFVALALVGPSAVSGTDTRNHAKVTPVQKVIQMMEEMLAKGRKEKEDEIKVMNDYTEWVDDETTRLTQQIKTAKMTIEKLIAEIEVATADIEELRKAIEVLDADIATWEADQKAATELRESEKAEYLKASQDLGESVDALGRAIAVLSRENYSRAQAEMLLQKMAVTMPPMRRVLAAFLAEASATKKETAPFGAPDVAAYEFQSGGIIEMLEKLEKEFKKELADVEDQEANRAHNYDLEMLHLSNQIEYARKDRTEKAQIKADRTQAKAEAEGQLADTKVDLAADEKTLADMQATYEEKRQAFEANQQIRLEELEALSKAVEIISSGKVKGHDEKYLPQFLQKKTTALVQLRSSVKSTAMARESHHKAAAEFLQRQASKLGSKILSLAALQAAKDPFAKVIKMVKDLIARLMEEAAAEAEHKAFCDNELHHNKLTREKKTAEVEQLTATKDELEAAIKQLAEEIEVLLAEQAALDKAMREATAERLEEKQNNEQTIADSKEAQEAVGQALSLLKEFYAKAGGEEAALLQQVPEMAAYKGMQGAKGGVIGMLEVIQSDFARLEAETTAAEEEAAAAYDSFMTDSKAQKEAKHKEEFDKSLLKDKKEHEHKLTVKDLENTQAALDAALAYYEKLKPECIEIKVSYEERVKRRKEEIEALQQAYNILDGAELPAF